jgi:succinate-semialdehyde dehydrogenase / glutarate-semialdehyde dehydrogenase
MSLVSMNPNDGEVLHSYKEMDANEVKTSIDHCHEAFLEWRHTEFGARCRLMLAVARLLRDRREDSARLMALEMGKPLTEGRAEIEKCAVACEYFAEHAQRFLANVPVESTASKSFIAFEPLGVVLAIMPWNFPFWQVIRFAAPGLMVGNGAILKHAANVTGCALALEELFHDAGFPRHLFSTLRIASAAIEQAIAHPQVAAVTLTGSTPAGRSVAARAGALLKKTVLELGGSDPYLILEDADIDRAVSICVASRLINSGQSCINAKRFIIPRSLVARIEERFVVEMKARVVGDPLDTGTQVGPLARADLRTALHQQVTDSVARGARCLLGGHYAEDEPGFFYPPTVLAGVQPGMPAYHEELFGPVAALISVDSEEEAVRIANDSPFGLGAAVFTEDLRHGEAVARRLAAGNCFVNDFVRSDPRLPFGGIKDSGYGRELGELGIREFVNAKTIYVR